MTATIESYPDARTRLAAEPAVFSVPARHNPRLQNLVERIHQDDELRQIWRCANQSVLNRPELGDAGEVHAHIVANAALKLLRLLREAGQVPAAIARHRLTPEEAEVIVVLASAVHDLGLAVFAESAAAAHASLVLADRKCRELLSGLYPARERTIIAVECLHAVMALQPTAAEYFQRIASTYDHLANLAGFETGGSRMGEVFKMVFEGMAADGVLTGLGYRHQRADG